MTNDEIRERIKFVTMDEEDGVPGARFAREMGEEVLRLRVQLAQAQPLLDAAVAFGALCQSNRWDAAWANAGGRLDVAAEAFYLARLEQAQAASAAKG